MIITKLSEFKIEGKVPSYNMSFKINYHKRSIYLTKVAHDFKCHVKEHMPYIKVDPEKDFLVIEISVIQNWYYKNGNLKKQDIQNMDKLYIDALCEHMGIDDSHVRVSHIEKIQSAKKTYSIVLIYKGDRLLQEKDM